MAFLIVSSVTRYSFRTLAGGCARYSEPIIIYHHSSVEVMYIECNNTPETVYYTG